MDSFSLKVLELFEEHQGEGSLLRQEKGRLVSASDTGKSCWGMFLRACGPCPQRWEFPLLFTWDRSFLFQYIFN